MSWAHRYSHFHTVGLLPTLVCLWLMFHRSIQLGCSCQGVWAWNSAFHLFSPIHPSYMYIPTCTTQGYTNSFFPSAASLWNSLPGACFPSILQSILFQEESQFPQSAPLSLFTSYFSSNVALFLEWRYALFRENMHNKILYKIRCIGGWGMYK